MRPDFFIFFRRTTLKRLVRPLFYNANDLDDIFLYGFFESISIRRNGDRFIFVQFFVLFRTALPAKFDPSPQSLGGGVDKGRAAGQLATLHRADDRLPLFVADRCGEEVAVKTRPRRRS